MPQRSKKDHKRSHHTERGSRWHNFHFSGKVIVCSVILGFMLILVGGILLAIGMDREEDAKDDNYDDLQKKPPMVYVGPAIMGIGGFAVIVGVLMCLIETKVCRKRNPDASPLINAEGEQTEARNSDGTVRDTDPTAVPSTSGHHRDKHRSGAHKKSPSPRKSKGSSKKPYSRSEKNQAKSSEKFSSSSEDGSKSKNFLTASDTFLTPPNSFTEVPDLHEKSRDKENPAAMSLMQSLTSSGKSWTTSAEFQTPSASFVDDPLSLQFMDRKENHVNENHKFLTPMNSDAGILSDPHSSEKEQIQKLGSACHSEENLVSQLNIQEQNASPCQAIPVQAAEADQNNQRKPAKSEILLEEKSSNAAEIEPTGENQSLTNDLQSETNKNASSESMESISSNENTLRDTNIEEINSDGIKDKPTIDNLEESSPETNDSNTKSDEANSEEITEDTSKPSIEDNESSNEHCEDNSSEITSTNDEAGASDTTT